MCDFFLGLCSLGVPVFTLQTVVSVCHKMSEVTIYVRNVYIEVFKHLEWAWLQNLS